MKTIQMSVYELHDLRRIVEKYIDERKNSSLERNGSNHWDDRAYDIERANILLKRLDGIAPVDYAQNSISYMHEKKIRTKEEMRESAKHHKEKRGNEND